MYPFNRSQECSWQPEEVARHLGSLVHGGSSTGGGTNNSTTGSNSNSSSSSFLLTRGWSTGQVPTMRQLYGQNVISEKEESSSSSQSGICHYVPIIATAIFGQWKEPLNVMLLGSAIVSCLLGNTADAISIGVALLIVSLVAAIQEYRSEAALEKLQTLVPPTCTAVRDGHVTEGLLAKELVIGDLVLLGTGDRVPADCRVVDALELLVDESCLTGENHPVAKTGSAGTDTKSNMAFTGTLVNAGRGRALVVAVGRQTEFGKIASELEQVESRKSPLQSKMEELGNHLAKVSGIAIVIIGLIGTVFWGRPVLETITIAVSLAVAAIPEGLPICVTVTLALGVLRMARKKAIVKKLPVVESLGCASVVASDKTGTLTQNEMTVRQVYIPGVGNFEVTGLGYHGEGTVRDAATQQVPSPVQKEALSALFQTASLCNNASLNHDDDPEESHAGQPTELALLVASRKCHVEDPRPSFQRLQEIPFSSERKRMEVRARPFRGFYDENDDNASFFASALKNNATTDTANTARSSQKMGRRDSNSASSEGALYFVKGMPESVIRECSMVMTSSSSDNNSNNLPQPMTEQWKQNSLRESRKMASKGLRVLALAYGPSLTQGLIFCGLVGMEDPLRDGVPEAVQQLNLGGVKVLMVTGDSKETAMSIAKQCGIIKTTTDDSDLADHNNTNIEADEEQKKSTPPRSGNSLTSPRSGGYNSFSDDNGSCCDLEAAADHQNHHDYYAMSGDEMDAIRSTSELAERIHGVRVFYRVSSQHKLALVRALQHNGEIVAVTGDGVNDALSLKGADIGISMGKCGTDVAKEASDVVLADDDFTTITSAIAEGKGIFFNIRNFLSFQLSTSLAALTMASIASVFGLPNPLNAMQILWINIIMDGPPAQSLGVEPVDDKILRAKPRSPNDPIITPALLRRCITSAALIVFVTLRVFSNELTHDGTISRRDTTMTFMTFVNCDLVHAYACRHSERCFYELSLWSNPSFLWAVGMSFVGQLLVIYWPPLQAVFQTESLSVGDLLYILLLSSSVLGLDTIRKIYFQSWFSDVHSQQQTKYSSSSKKKSSTTKSKKKRIKTSARRRRRIMGL